VPVIKAQPVPKSKNSSSSVEDTLALFCFYFPQYTYAQSKRMPYKRVARMLRIAERERARFLYDLTNIAAAPHTHKGQGVKKMLNYFKESFK